MKLSRRTVERQEIRQICRTIVVYRFKGKEKQFVFNSLFNREPVKSEGLYVKLEFQELTHEMDRYRWKILIGLCEMRWKNFSETTTEEGHTVFFSGKEDKHEQGVGFLVHKDIVNTVMGCRLVSSRLITIRLRAVPLNITVVQAYAPVRLCRQQNRRILSPATDYH